MLKKKMPVVQWAVLFFVGALLLGCEGNSKIFTSTVEAGKYGTTAITLSANSTESPPIIEVDQTLTFTVKSTDKDGQRTLNNKVDVLWSVDCTSPNCAWIDRDGLLTGIADGDATVTARYSGYSDSTTVKVSSAKLTDITVQRVATGTIDYCRSYEVTATGVYDDGTTRDITDLATWGITGGGDLLKESDGKITFSSSIDTAVTVQATHASFESASVTGDGEFKVDGSVPTLAINPQVITRVYKDQSKQFTAVATWDSGTEDVTKNVSWSSSDKPTLDFSGNTTLVDASQRQDGLATGEKAGAATVTAACGVVASEAKDIIVSELVISGIRIFRGAETLDSDEVSRYVLSVGSVTTFRAEPVYEGGAVPDASQDITFDCEWSKIDPNSAAITVGNSDQESDPLGKRKGDVKGVLSTNDDYAVFTVRYSKNGSTQDDIVEPIQVKVQQ